MRAGCYEEKLIVVEFISIDKACTADTFACHAMLHGRRRKIEQAENINRFTPSDDSKQPSSQGSVQVDWWGANSS